MRSQCTRAKTNPRGLTIQAQPDDEALQKGRERQKTEEFQKQYALRSGIEGTISQGIRAFELRDCRYIGLAKTHLQHILTAAALNLSRVFALVRGDTNGENSLLTLGQTGRLYYLKGESV